jgi:hypothetical protein
MKILREGKAKLFAEAHKNIKSRRALPFGNALPLLWMWGVKEKDMACGMTPTIYKLLSEIIPNQTA